MHTDMHMQMDILTHPKEISPIQGNNQIRLEPNSRKPEKKSPNI